MSEETSLATAILRDVPIRGRIYTGGRINTGGNCLDELVLKKDVLAALTAALDGVDERAGEVLPRLRKADEYEPLGHDGWEAADLITALLTQNAALRAERDALKRHNNALSQMLDGEETRAAAAEAEVEKLRGALSKLHHAVCGETGFAACVRLDSGKAYPWPALDDLTIVDAAITPEKHK